MVKSKSSQIFKKTSVIEAMRRMKFYDEHCPKDIMNVVTIPRNYMFEGEFDEFMHVDYASIEARVIAQAMERVQQHLAIPNLVISNPTGRNNFYNTYVEARMRAAEVQRRTQNYIAQHQMNMYTFMARWAKELNPGLFGDVTA